MNRVSQFAAIASLKDHNHLKDVISKVKNSLKKIEEIAIKNNCKFVKSSTNFLAIDCGYDGLFAKKVLDNLISNGIFVRMPFTSPENRCIRVSAGTDEDINLFEERFPRALKQAKDFFKLILWRDKMLQDYPNTQLFINGEWQNSKSKKL